MKASAEFAARLFRAHPEGLTRLEAIRQGVGNLPARVLEMKQAGLRVDDEWETTRNSARVKRYFLVEAAPVYSGSQERLSLI